MPKFRAAVQALSGSQVCRAATPESGHQLRSSHAPAQLHNSSHKPGDEDEEQEQERPAAQKWAKVFARPAHDRLQDTEGGACSRLYHYLWCKDDNGHSPREFRLPDTVRG